MKPESESSGMWIPLSLAIPLMECYFGTGPRRSERPSPSHLPSPSPGEPPSDSAFSTLHAQSSLPGFRPRGVAALRNGSPPKVEPPAPPLQE